MFYSATTGGFYGESEAAPADAVAISTEEYLSLLEGQSSGFIVANQEGYPELIDPPPLSPEFYATIERKWRDEQLSITDGVVSRHRDELEEGVTTTLVAEQYTELQAYRRALREWPQGGSFPLIEHRPAVPTWLEEQIL